MEQNFTKGFDVVKLLTETCMEKIFGKRWEICECLEDDWNMVQVYNELVSMFNKLSIESPIWITMLVRSLGGKIKFVDKPYLFRGKINIYGLEYDNDCGLTFACCADGDDDFYIEDEFTWAEAQEFIQFLSGQRDDIEKMPYLNSIFFTLKNHQASHCYDFDFDGDRVITDEEGREIEVRRVFITNDYKNKELVGINYTIKGEGDDLNFNFLLNFDLDFIKQLFKVFTEQIYGKDNYGQIVDID